MHVMLTEQEVNWAKINWGSFLLFYSAGNIPNELHDQLIKYQQIKKMQKNGKWPCNTISNFFEKEFTNSNKEFTVPKQNKAKLQFRSWESAVYCNYLFNVF